MPNETLRTTLLEQGVTPTVLRGLASRFAYTGVLYNSIYRADDQLMVNPHIYGFGAAHAPVLHLRKISGGDLVSTHQESFDRVWAEARPLE